MTDISVPTNSIIPLLHKLAAKERLTTDKSGVSEVGRRISGKSKSGIKVFLEDADGVEFPFVSNERYLYNLYDNTEKETREVRKVEKEYIDSIAKHLSYHDIASYLVKEGYIDPETSQPIKSKSIDLLIERNPPHPNEWIDKYILGARFVPSLISLSSIPILFSILVLDKYDIPNFSVWMVLIVFITVAYAISGWLSMRGKEFEKKYFFSTSQKGFPTGYLMLYSHNSKYSENQKREYREKVIAYFGLHLKSKKEEGENEAEALQLLHESGTKVKDNVKSNIIRSSNIRYGLIRNLVPSTILAAVISIVELGVGVILKDQLISISSGVLILIFSFSYFQLRFGNTLKQAAEAYAIYLLDEFLSR
ncbi:hypothetical protein SAMN04488029_2691 [Reichenbachiella faecimaris]|uniref:Uncharacterized protein n=1 Tax=Reichenbachiella faecimaris TaxID=692418 RepID=A0A1W2GHL3_REIFA|nr:hypothetical protein [Reichenbachiella faecimaris]SMD36061.1 hypothetical protein SAMN04488029_2691 [Reichenbachiella faecimaris]